MSTDKVEIAHYPVIVLSDGRHLIRPETLTDEEYLAFYSFLNRFPLKFEWSDALEGWISLL